mgnify:CR=1 FL=1
MKLNPYEWEVLSMSNQSPRPVPLSKWSALLLTVALALLLVSLFASGSISRYFFFSSYGVLLAAACNWIVGIFLALMGELDETSKEGEPARNPSRHQASS